MTRVCVCVWINIQKLATLDTHTQIDERVKYRCYNDYDDEMMILELLLAKRSDVLIFRL